MQMPSEQGSMEEIQRDIETMLAGLDWDFPEGAAESFRRYLAELMFWNRKVGLVKASPGELIFRHLRDSLVALPVLRDGGLLLCCEESGEGPSLVDIGSGGGFPGIPLAISLGEWKVSLVERSGRKAGFLRNAVALLGLAGRVEVLETDALRLPARWNLAVSRAFMPLSRALPVMLDRVCPGGSVALYGGTRETIQGELELLQGMEELGGARIISLDSGERNLVIVSRRSTDPPLSSFSSARPFPPGQ